MKPPTGIKVIELVRVLAGAWCGQLLADLGAEVIKIERPGTGDDKRHWGPPLSPMPWAKASALPNAIRPIAESPAMRSTSPPPLDKRRFDISSGTPTS